MTADAHSEQMIIDYREKQAQEATTEKVARELAARQKQEENNTQAAAVLARLYQNVYSRERLQQDLQLSRSNHQDTDNRLAMLRQKLDMIIQDHKRQYQRLTVHLQDLKATVDPPDIANNDETQIYRTEIGLKRKEVS